MTNEVAKKIVRGIKDKIQCNTVDLDDWAEFWGFTREEYEEFLDMAIKALETASCIKEKCAYCPHCENCDVDDETLEIKALEQQSHNAKFVPSRDGYDGHVTCNNCFKIYDWDSEAQYFNYCPKCGADMRGNSE